MTGIDKRMAKQFEEFLAKGGAEILPPTNAWELARFKTSNGVCVVYQNAKHRVSYSNEHAHNAFTAWQENRPWTAGAISERIKRKTVEELLIERDGCGCFYCNTFDFSVTSGKPTLEHLLSISDGGNNHLSNLVLACQPCNKEAGSLPIIEKVRLRERKQAA